MEDGEIWAGVDEEFCEVEFFGEDQDGGLEIPRHSFIKDVAAWPFYERRFGLRRLRRDGWLVELSAKTAVLIGCTRPPSREERSGMKLVWREDGRVQANRAGWLRFGPVHRPMRGVREC